MIQHPQPNSRLPAEFNWEPATLLSIGWQKKRQILIGMVIGIAAGVALAQILPRVYQSSAQITIVKKRPDAMTGSDARHMGSEDFFAPPQELLKSSTIINAALQTKGLGLLATFDPENGSLSEQIRNALSVSAGKAVPGQPAVYKVSCRGSNTDDCRAVLAAVLQALNEFLAKKYQTSGDDTLSLILREKDALQKSLKEKEIAYREFREKAPLLGKNKDGLELRQERLSSIQSKLSALLLQRLELEGQRGALEAAVREGRGEDAILAMILEAKRSGETSESARERQLSLQEQLLPLLQEEKKLQQLYGAKHPDLVAVSKRIEATRRLFLLPATAWSGQTGAGDRNRVRASDPASDPVALHLELLKQKIAQLKTSEDLLTKALEAEQEEARRLAAFEIQNDALRTSISLDQQLYESLAKRLSEVNLIKDAGGYQVEVIEPPSGGRPVAPSLAVFALVGSFFGLVAGWGLAFLTDRSVLKMRVRLGEHVEAMQPPQPVAS
jgi:uncharacterized protein involved in exopolysaccharide biosynthesis